MKWSQKRFNQKYSSIENTEEYWVLRRVVFPALSFTFNCFAQMDRHSWSCFSSCSVWLMQRHWKCWTVKLNVIQKTKLYWKIGETCMSALSETLSFQSNSPWFNVSELKLSTLKGNQCNRFLGSLLLLSLLWFPVVWISPVVVIGD